MKISLFATAITLSAMFTTNAAAQQFEAGQNDQLLLASNRGSGTSRGSSTQSTPSSDNTTRSTPSHAPSSNNAGNSGATGRGKLQNSQRSGSDSRGSQPNSTPEPKSTIKKKDHVRSNHRPHGPRHYRRGTPPPPPSGGEVVVVTSSDNYYVESTSEIDDALPMFMGEIYAGGNLSSIGDNDLHLGYSAGAKAEIGLPRGGYYGSIGARYSKQNFNVFYGNEIFPKDESEVEVTHLQIPTTLFGYRRYLDDNVMGGVGIGLIYQYGLGGTTTSKYHDDFDYTYHREKVDTYNEGLMSRSDLHARLELFFCFNHLSITGEVAYGIINHNHFPNNVTNWECSRNQPVANYLLTVGYRIF
ncbi:MAG: hypothetical protein IKP37_10035 [Paludibacteraceae bacterium]|nr:hypothetical protein [Paludibacteraceae bacterium]